MTDVGAELSLELTKIIECPYPASLSRLAVLLARADILTIRACIRDRSPCAVSRLATLVCEALPLWAYTLRILLCLCQSAEFRDTLLRQVPCFLSSLLTKANASQHESDECAELCVLLLSRPLPGSIPLPAHVQTFFLQKFAKAIESPNVATLKPVYTMLDGACRHLLILLPVETRQKLDEDLSHTFSSQRVAQDFMLFLWCSGIALLAEHGDEIGQEQSSRPGLGQSTCATTTERQWKTASCRKLFGSISKMYKTIHMTYLSVKWATNDATRGGVGVSDEEAIKGIRIAVRILQLVDRTALDGWPKSNRMAMETFSRLPSKILRTSINPTVQLEALCFCAIGAGEGNLPPEITARYEHCLTDIANLVGADCLDGTLAVSLPLFSLQMQENSIHVSMANLLDACISPPNTHELSNYIALVEQLTASLLGCAPLQDKLLSVILSKPLQAKIWDLMEIKLEGEKAAYHTHALSLHRQILSATIAFLLTLTMTTQSTSPLALPLALTTALISKQRQLPHVVTRCSHVPAAPESTTVSLFQQENTPYTSQHLKDWRDRLKLELDSHGSYQKDMIIRSVAQICQDLDNRCNTVEEPLRREQERSQELERRLAELSKQVKSLETQLTDDQLHIEGLEDERLNISEEKDGLTEKLKELEAQYDEASRKADEKLRIIQEELYAKELELRSTVLTHEESLRAHDNENDAHSSIIAKLKAELESAHKPHGLLSDKHEDLQRRCDDIEQRLNRERETVRSQSNEIVQLQDRSTKVEDELHHTESELKVITHRLSDLQVTHQELVQSSEEAYKNLETRYASDINAAAAQAKEDSNKLEAQRQGAEQNIRRAEEIHKETRRELEMLQTSIPLLEARLQELTEFYSEQEEELVELRTVRKNVLAMMGPPSQQPLAIRSDSWTQMEANERHIPRAPREHRRRKSALTTQDTAPKISLGTQAITSAMENIANASFASSDSNSSQDGPNPKRSKPRPAFKVPSMHTPYTKKPTLMSKPVSKRLSPSKRSVLRQMSPNQRHTTVGFTLSENEEKNLSQEMRSVRKMRGSLQGIEQADFDLEGSLAGTPLTPGNFTAGTGKLPEHSDVTTTKL